MGNQSLTYTVNYKSIFVIKVIIEVISISVRGFLSPYFDKKYSQVVFS